MHPGPLVIHEGKPVSRVRYGNEQEDWGANNRPCHDCGVAKGDLHIYGCDAERCPVCGGQFIYCDCVFTDPSPGA